MDTNPFTKQTKTKRGVLRWLIRETMGVFMIVAALFLSAGVLDWLMGWAMVVITALWVDSTALNQAAHAASHTKDTYLSAQYRRLVAPRRKKKAIVALEHTILVIAYHLIKRKEIYRELGGDYFDKRRSEVTGKRLVKRLEQLSYSVSLQQPVLCAAG